MEPEGAGPWLAATGLLPAADLLAAAGLPHDGACRRDFRLLRFATPNGAGRAMLRFQQMPDHALAPTLAGTYAGRPADWRRLVDSHVFFWADAGRRDRFIATLARLRGPGHAPAVLAFDTAALLSDTKQDGTEAFFTTVNSGSCVRGGARIRRDEATFRPVADYRGGRVAELAIRGRVARTPAATHNSLINGGTSVHLSGARHSAGASGHPGPSPRQEE
jgi:hypothetical protein